MNEKIKYAIEHTKVLKPPQKLLATFGSTTMHYYILTEPMYIEFEGKEPEAETVVREGKITWQRPKLLTPSYILRAEGFSEEAREAFKMLAREDPDLAMMLYSLKFKKDSEKMDIVSNSLMAIAKKLANEIEKKGDEFCAIIKGVDEFWDVSLSKFIQEMVIKSAYFSQLPDLREKSIIEVGNTGYPVIKRDLYGIPITARNEIERLFKLYEKGELEPYKLKQELDRWGVFDQYQDRFFNFFKRS